jgi:hypothetical protein
MAAWQPAQEGLQQIIQLLKLSQSPDHDIQKQVNQVHCAPFFHFPGNIVQHVLPPPLLWS